MSDVFWQYFFSNLPALISAVGAVLAAIWSRRSVVDTNKGRQETRAAIVDAKSGFDPLATQGTMFVPGENTHARVMKDNPPPVSHRFPTTDLD